MAFDFRALAVATAGFSAFVNLYSPQALLPELAGEFHVGPGEISSLMTASTAAIASSARFTGALADVLGRKRLIVAAMFAITVPTVIMTFAATVPQLVLWRFVQGSRRCSSSLSRSPASRRRVAGARRRPRRRPLCHRRQHRRFSGRFIPGILTDVIGWRSAIQVVALITLVAAVIAAPTPPRERQFVRSGGLLLSLSQMFRHFLPPPPGRDFCHWLRRAPVQFHRRFHLWSASISPGRPTSSRPRSLARCSSLISYPVRCCRGPDAPSRCSATCCFRARHHRGVDRRRVAAVGAARLDHRFRADAVRGVRHAVPDNLDRICHAHRQAGPLVGGAFGSMPRPSISAAAPARS